MKLKVWATALALCVAFAAGIGTLPRFTVRTLPPCARIMRHGRSLLRLSTERRRGAMHRVLLMRGKPGTRRLLAPMILALILSGCASNPTPLAVDCPQPPQVPASLARSSLPEVQALSSEAQSYFKDVSAFLRELQSTKTP